jgi:hypothetical protein
MLPWWTDMKVKLEENGLGRQVTVAGTPKSLAYSLHHFNGCSGEQLLGT